MPGPFDCWLVLRGIKTLPLRMRQHDANGRRIAQWLAGDRRAESVYYPGLPSHPQHELACRQMSGFGGMISFEPGSLERARRIVEHTRLFALAESLGGVESLIGHPATMTHAAVPKAMREAMGLTDGLVRLSVGSRTPTTSSRTWTRRWPPDAALKQPRTRDAVGESGILSGGSMTDADQSLPARRPRTVLTQISSRAWEHAADRAALQPAARHSRLRRSGPEGVRLLRRSAACACSSRPTPCGSGPTQFPRVCAAFTDVCATMDWEPRPELFVSQTPMVNAGAFGMDRPFIVLNSGALALLDDEELRAILGHELGHVISGHALYRTILVIILEFGFGTCRSSPASRCCRSRSRCSSGSARASCRATAPGCSAARTRSPRCACS